MDEVELSQGEVRSRGRLEGAGIRWERNPYIEVVELQLGQGVIKSSLDILWGVLVIPQLGGDEDVLSLQAGNISECALDALADFLLVAVDLGQVKVTVADLESLIDTVADLAGSGLPGAVPNTGDGMARVESDGLAEGHFAGFWGGDFWSISGKILVDFLRLGEEMKGGGIKDFKSRERGAAVPPGVA